jgi:hypothetical protein
MKFVSTGGFEFGFEDALDAFIFDETDSSKPTYHGAPMKAVDIIAEFSQADVYVEVKDYADSSIFNSSYFKDDLEVGQSFEAFNWLKNYLKLKFRDSYLYRHAEGKVDKPVHYICLLTLDNALNSLLRKSLRNELPVGRVTNRWLKPLATSCDVVNLETWNHNFPKWPVARTDSTKS